MAPKKKSRVSQTASPAPPPSRQGHTTVAVEIERRRRPKPADTPSATAPPEPDAEEQDEEDADAVLVADAWTDDEEIGLFKGLVRWKPTGMHKHFHILALHQHLLSNGYIHPRAPHTRIPGIWSKLHELYDLEALDEREDANAAPWSPSPDEEDVDAAADEKDELGDDEDEPENMHATEFELPDEDFGRLVWRARFPDEDEEDDNRESSPPQHEELMPGPDSPPVRFTPTFEVALSEARTPSTRGTASRSKGTSTVKAKAKPPPRRSSRVADSVDPDDDDNNDEEEESEGDDQSEQDSMASGTPAPKSSKNKSKRTRPAPKSRTSKRRR